MSNSELAGVSGAELRARFLEAMSHAANTVNVITTDGAGGRHGLTVSAMTSVSADGGQPALLICVHHRGRSAPAILQNGVFCVNVLRDTQSELSDCFAGRRALPDDDRFALARWTTLATGAPCLQGALATFDCRVTASQQVGTHYVIFGAVVDVRVADEGLPLIYARRAYARPHPIPC